MPTPRSFLFGWTLFLLHLTPLHAADWPQYRGPQRDDVSAETGLLPQWPANGPLLLWTYADAGIGYSGPAIVGDRFNNNNMTNHHGNVLLLDGHIYGFSQGKGWMCHELETGNIAWTERRGFGGGAVTCADGKLYCYSEGDGAVALAEASTTGWKELGKFKIPRQSSLRKPLGKIWTPPVVSGGRLFLRDQELVFCYDVKRPNP